MQPFFAPTSLRQHHARLSRVAARRRLLDDAVAPPRRRVRRASARARAALAARVAGSPREPAASDHAGGA